VYSNGKLSAEGSTKKSNGLITVIDAEKSTSIFSSVAFSGKTNRASQLPCGSCCQFTKWFEGVTLSE
jgi:hypothetical protein